MTNAKRPKGRPARKREEGTAPDTRMAKSLRVLAALRERGQDGTGPCLNRERLAAAADVTVRNLDAILKSLRAQGSDIRWEESRGYWIDETVAGPGFRVRTPEGFRSLRTLRAFVAEHGELLERERWLGLLDDILSTSETSRKKHMGREFEEARIDEEGRVFRVAEPEILYLNVHRPRPETMTRHYVERLTEAIRGCHPVRMHYVDREGVKDVVQVEPYFVFYREGTYYLGGVQTHSADAPLKTMRFKPFTITTMRCLSLDVLHDHAFTPQERYSADKRLTRTGIKGPDGEAPVEAEFEVFGRFAYNACETDHGERSEHAWIRNGPHSQHLKMKATFGSLYDLVRYILSFGKFAVLDRPEDVRGILVDNIKGMAARYGLEVVEPRTPEARPEKSSV